MATVLEIITGSMYGGKSEELVRRLARAAYANRRILLIKPNVDDRKERNVFALTKRNKKLARYKYLAKHSVKSVGEIKKLISEFAPDILALDEAQFFDDKKLFHNQIPKLIDQLLADNCDSDLTVIVSGLDMNYKRTPFWTMAQLMAMADRVDKYPAVCLKCKGKRGQGILTQKKESGSGKTIEVGGIKLYEARCRADHTIPT